MGHTRKGDDVGGGTGGCREVHTACDSRAAIGNRTHNKRLNDRNVGTVRSKQRDLHAVIIDGEARVERRRGGCGYCYPGDGCVEAALQENKGKEWGAWRTRRSLPRR